MSLAWWYGCPLMIGMSLGGTNSSIFIIWENPRTPTIMSWSHGIELLGWFSITPRLSEIGSQISFLSLEVVGSSSLVRTWTKPPSFFVFKEFLCLVRPSRLFSFFSLSFMSDKDKWLTGTLVLQFLSVLVWRRGTNVTLRKQRSILSSSRILMNLFLLNLCFYTFWVQNRLLRFRRIWKLWERVHVSTFSFLFFFSLLFFIFILLPRPFKNDD